jgi:hypothetical protein
MSPMLVKFIVLGLLSTGWLALHHQIKRLDANQAYHVAAYRRDRRKARLYFHSVWIGLIAAFLSFGCLEALSGVEFESGITRDWVLGVLRGLGLWGLLIVGAVWSQVGQRASLPNSDGKSLVSVPEEREN